MSMSIFDISGRAMSAQIVRLSATASNMANAGAIAGSASEAYRARRPIFQTSFDDAQGATVDAVDVVQSGGDPIKRYEPGHPMADKDGYIYESSVDPTVEMVELLEASRQYQNNVEVLQTAKQLMLNTLKLGQ